MYHFFARLVLLKLHIFKPKEIFIITEGQVGLQSAVKYCTNSKTTCFFKGGIASAIKVYKTVGPTSWHYISVARREQPKALMQGMARVSKDRMGFHQCSDFIHVREIVQGLILILADGPVPKDNRKGEHKFDKTYLTLGLPFSISSVISHQSISSYAYANVYFTIVNEHVN